MRILITGICGFAGSALCESLLSRNAGVSIFGIDNLMRPGAETNRIRLRKMGVEFFHGDIRCASDLAVLPKADWVIDAAANPSVLAGIDGAGGSRRLFEHNVGSIGNVLEYCRFHDAGLCLLSSSRVYSIPELASLPLSVEGRAFKLDAGGTLPPGVSERGISNGFSTAPPISLYGSTKLASEILALEYGAAFGFPVWITRCGVLAGEGQFGTPDQGIFSYWLHAHLGRRALRYIGFDGTGRQVRDAFHPEDLAALLDAQMRSPRKGGQRIYTAGGGPDNALALAELTAWCDERFGAHAVEADVRPRPYDVPWVIMDNSDVYRDFGWVVQTRIAAILERIACHAERNPGWLELSGI
jgi:CDP-paratose 2-epimerase